MGNTDRSEQVVRRTLSELCSLRSAYQYYVGDKPSHEKVRDALIEVVRVIERWKKCAVWPPASSPILLRWVARKKDTGGYSAMILGRKIRGMEVYVGKREFSLPTVNLTLSGEPRIIEARQMRHSATLLCLRNRDSNDLSWPLIQSSAAWCKDAAKAAIKYLSGQVDE